MRKHFLEPQVAVGPLCILDMRIHDGLLTTDKIWSRRGGHIGELKGTAHLVYPGVDLDGDSDYIEIPDHDDFTPAGTKFSISAWVYMHDATEFIIASKGVYNTDGEWRFATELTDKLYAIAMDESVANCFIGRIYNTALTSYQNIWIHVLTTYGGGATSSSFKLYLNGVNVDNADNENLAASFVSIEDLTHAVWIGRDATTYSNGLIDNVMMWKKELSAMDALNIYNVTKWRYGV